MPERTYDDLYSMQYIVGRVVKELGFGGTLIYLDQWKAYDKVDYRNDTSSLYS